MRIRLLFGFSSNTADFISKILSAPTIAVLVSTAFSLWSPIGLGLLNPLFSILLCVLLLALLPIAPVIYFSRKKLVDLYVSKMEMRTPFFLLAIGSYMLASLTFWIMQATIIFLISISYVCVTSAVMTANFFWKASIHGAAVAGPVTALVSVFGLKAAPLFILLVPVIWARMKLKAHTFPQILGGIVIAVVVTVGVYALLYH